MTASGSDSKKSKKKGKHKSEGTKTMKKSLPTSRFGKGRPDTNQRLEQQSSSPIKPLQSAINAQRKCFQDAAGATILGTLVLDALWEEIKRTKYCRAEEIDEILDAYFRPDLIVQDQTDTVIINSLQEYKQKMMNDLVYACLYQDVSFEPTQEATTEPGIFDDFAWIGNRIVQDSKLSQPTTTQEIYLIELLGAAGSFLYTGKGGSGKSSKSKDSPFFYSYHGKGGSSKYGQHQCHRPQIYGIVMFDL